MTDNGSKPIMLLIPQQLAQGIVNYLVQRPYNEVAGLIADLSQLEAASESEPVVKEK